jgi:hypothetical protein
MPRLSRSVARRIAALSTAVTVALVLLTSGAIENGRADSRPVCTHGASSLGPIVLQDGQVVGGSTTPTTEACLP